MANNSEKQAQKTYEKYKTLYMQIILAVTAFHVLFRIVLSYDSFFFMNAVGFVVFSVVNFYGYKLLMYYLVNGHPRSSYGTVEEILWVNWFIEVATCLSGYFWLLYLAVPGYAIYIYGPMVLKMLFPDRGSMAMDAQPAAQQKVKTKVRYA